MTVMETIRTTDADLFRDGCLSSREVADLVGISFRKLDYWTRLGAVVPTRLANGPGSRRRWSPNEVKIIRAVAALMDLGMTVEEAGDAAAELRTLPVEEWTGPWITRGRIIDLSDLVG